MRHNLFKQLRWVATGVLLALLALSDLSAQNFAQKDLNFNGNGGVSNGTSLMYGPDGRLYVLNLNGTIDIFTIQKNGVGEFLVTDSEELLDVKLIPNHNDDGASNSGNNREATGLTVAGTATNPIIYVTSSDSRVGGPGGDLGLDTNSGVITRLTWNGTAWEVVDLVRGLPRSEENHATNGLEFVTVNGSDYLIVSQGGHANAGAPSDNFAWTPEFALSAAVLSINLSMLESMPILNDGRDYIYDIPTLDDPSRDNIFADGTPAAEDPDDPNYSPIDIGDPWGGNDGINQAMLVIGGPVQIFSPGYRNTYDLTVTQDGKVYVTDNGANGGWGGLPENEGVDGTVTNNYDPSEPGSSSQTADGEQVNNLDHLTMVTDNIQTYNFGSFYGGHPTPVRANPVGSGLYTNPSVNNTNGAVFRTLIYDPDGSRGAGYTTDASIALPANWPPVPVSLANPVEGDWRGPGMNNPDGDDDVLVTTWANNSNGIDEYTSTIFTGVESMVGDLIAGKSGGVLWRVILNPDGSKSQLIGNNGVGPGSPTGTFSSGLGGNPLGITCNSDTDPFPGTIWVATFSNTIKILDPQPSVVCYPVGNPLYVGSEDTDLDGYTNDDEVDNNVDHCNGGSQPDDFDKVAGGTLLSDRLDLDDDNDGINDSADPFQLGDPADAGSDAFDLPLINDLKSGNAALNGYFGLGFTGLMNNGNTALNWIEWIDVPGDGPNPNDLLGGAIEAMTMQMTEGTALGTANTQEKAFQYGVNVSQATGGFTVSSRIFNFDAPLQLYGASAPANGELGIFIGDGTQSNYIKAVITQAGLEARQEINDVPQAPITFPISVPNRPLNEIVFFFQVNPANGQVQVQYSIDGVSPAVTLATITAQGSILTAIQQANTPLAVGLIGSSNTPGVELEGTWDYLNVVGSQPSIAQQLPDLDKLIDDPADNLDLDTYFDDDNGANNLTYTIEANTDPTILANIVDNILTLTYPSTAASTSLTIRATDGGGLFVEQSFTVNVTDQPIVLFRVNAGDVLIAATDAPNLDWAANTGTGAQSGTGFTVNTGNISTHNTTGRHSSVPAYAPQSLFANERWDPAPLPEMEWTFATGNGNFIVNLYMANGFAGTSTPGTRVFDVFMEGALVIDDKDLSAEYGSGIGAMESYQVSVSDGTLNIEFLRQVENPLINAIEILGTSSVVNPALVVDPVANQVNDLGEAPILNITASGGDPNENLAFSASGLPPGLSIEPTNGAILGTISTATADAGVYNSSITVSKPSSTPVVVNFTWTVIDPAAPNTVLYRVNTGGGLTASTDASPVGWGEDQATATANGAAVTGTPSQYVNSSAEDITFGAALPGAFVNNTGYPNSLFTTERYNTGVVPDNMQWDFPLSNGTYTVNLIFAEVWTGAQAAGVRVFDVEIEGQLSLDDFDQTATYGWATAGVESFTVNVTDGNLDIDFIMGVQNPNIKAIEIVSTNPSVNALWSNISNVTEHTPRHENSFVQVGDKFYLFGGRESADKMDMYDYQTDTWTQAASTAPFEFNHFQAVEYQGLIWVIGAFEDNDGPGPGGLDETPAENIYMYDPVTDVWIEGPAVPAGRQRGSAGLVMHNEKFYVIAGNTIGHSGGYIPWFDEFDPATGAWTPLADAPHARDHFHATVVNDKLYVLGGRLSGGTGGTFAPLVPEVDVYDFVTSTWSVLPVSSNLPTPRAASATVTFDGDVYVIGGEGNGQAYVNTDALNVGTGVWTAKADLNNARHGTQGIVSGDGIWITSGSPNQGGGNQTNMEVFGVDNPSGIPVVASTLTVPASATVPTSATQTFTIDNTGGNQGIYVSSLELSGTNAANFAILGSPSENFLIPAGGSRTIQVQHSGTLDGEIASLDISYGGTSTASVSLSSGQVAPTVLYRVNNGGPLVATTDAPNPDWTVDTGNFGVAGNSAYLAALSTGGSTFLATSGSAYQGPIIMTDPSLPVGTPVDIFESERYDPDALPEMLWQFPVDIGAQIEVRLYFAELFSGIDAAGERVFDVSIEGVVPPQLAGIDPFGRNGALGAFMLSHTLTATDGTLDIEFIHGVENPSVKAIEILSNTAVVSPNTAPIVTNPGTQSGVDGDLVSLQISATDADDCGGLTYSATGLPPSVSIDPATGLISGTLDAGTGGGVAGAFIESGGLVIMEAETDFVEAPGGWNLEAGTPTFLVASSNNFGNANAGQMIDYDVEINTPGVYRFHMKSVFSGTSSTDENDTWFKINNTSDVHFFCVQGGALSGSAQFLSELSDPANTTKTLYYPAGNAEGRPNHGTENPGNSGYFKVYRSGGGGNQWNTNTIDNNGFPIYAYFPSAGTFTIAMSERSSGHKVDRIALVHIDDVSTGVPTTTLDGPESQQAVGGTAGASAGSPYNVAVTVADNCAPSASTLVDFTWIINDTPPTGVASALIEITPDGTLGSSTYGGSSLQLSNTSTGNVQITSITIDISTGILPDNVFDPIGEGGDETASCLTANSGGTAVGYLVPTDPCIDPFSQPRFGGYDVMDVSFSDFDPGEQFNFTVDIDPNSIKDVPGAGGAGAVSGLELSGATVTITFSDGSTIVSSIYEDGSLGGGQAVVAANALPAPTISAVGQADTTCVAVANQTIEVSGTPGANVSLMLLDSRLFIQSGAPPFNVPDETFYANEIMAKALYTGVIGVGGTVQIPVVLLETVGAGTTPDGGLNYITAVVSNSPYAIDQQVSMTSNILILKVDPTCVSNDASISLNATIQTWTDHSGDYSVKLYPVGSTTAVYDLTATANSAGDMTVSGITPGTYQVAVKFPNSLQVVQTLTLVAGANTASMGELPTGDANNDNLVDLLDFSTLVATFNLGTANAGYDARADFNGSGNVDLLDFSGMVTNFNVPGQEPTN